MLEVTMTPEAADGYCVWEAPESPCLGMPIKWGCGDPECVMCCEAHKQGRGEDGCDSCASIGDLQERIAELREQNAALKAEVERLRAAIAHVLTVNKRWRDDGVVGCMGCGADTPDPHEDDCPIFALETALKEATDD